MKLVTQEIQQSTLTLAPTPTQRIIVVDCSGSMGSELPKLRTHLKNKLPTMIAEQDTLSIIWFSGHNECGVLFENMAISSLKDLTKINDAIDRYLRPTGLTAFVGPLEQVLNLVLKDTHESYTMSFMTDGYSNQDPSRKAIMDACKALDDKLASASFVEYGHYADSKMLLDMAESVGGSVVLAENFQEYEEAVNFSLHSSVSGKKHKVNVPPKTEFVVGNTPDGFVIARPDAVGLVTLPSNTLSYTYFEDKSGQVSIADEHFSQAANMVAALIQRGDAETATMVASVIGDVDLYQTVENAFSKQDYAVAVEFGKSIATGKRQLFVQPRKTNLMPDENAYNVLTLLMDLADGHGNYLDISHPDFSYNPIGPRRDTAVNEETGYVPKFKDSSDSVKGEISALKFDEDRPNISILVRRTGSVNLPPNGHGFGDSFDTFIWRNYTIIKDGIVNLRKLPVVLSKATYDLLTANGVPLEPFKVNHTYVIDTKSMPVINRSMVGKTTLTQLFTDAFDIYKLRVKQKVLGSRFEKPEFGQKFAGLYGDAGALFLKEIGISEGGFSPKTTKGENLDPYIAKVLEVKLSSLSSIPKVEDVQAAIAKGKTLTPSQKVVSDVLSECAVLTDDLVPGALKGVKEQIQVLRNKIVMTKFGIIIGKKLPTDMASPEDTSRELDFGLGKTITGTMILSDKEI